MRIARSFTLGLLAVAPAFVLYAASGSHKVTPGSQWLIDDTSCEIAASWSGGVRIAVKPDYAQPGEHEIAVHNPAFRNFVPGELVSVRFGAPEDELGQNEYSAMSRSEGKSKVYASTAFAEILDGLAATNRLRFYRSDDRELDLDITGFAAALAAMRDCEAGGATADAEKM